MAQAPPVVLVPGLLTSPRLFAEQLPALWRLGPVTIAGIASDDTMAAIAGRILAAAPGRFALVGLSMGGYIAFEVLRQAPERVDRLALLDTSARPDTPEQTRRHRLPDAGPGRRRRRADPARAVGRDRRRHPRCGPGRGRRVRPSVHPRPA